MRNLTAGRLEGTALTRVTLLVMAFAGLGGMLYGFDIGVISGALVFMETDLSITATQSSLVVSAVLGGGALATLVSGWFADRFGRTLSINVAAGIFLAGTVLLVFSNSFATVMGGRLVQGVSIGIITIVIPLYVAETVPARYRGRGVALFQLCLTFGILLGYLVNLALERTQNWQLMFATILVPGALFALGALFVLPRSPRWLYQHGFTDEARVVLIKTEGRANVSAALAEMRKVVDTERATAGGSWLALLRPGYRKAFFLALAVGVLNQLTGINVLLQFDAPILVASGMANTAILGSVGVGAVNFVVTAIALLLVDRIGRRPLLIAGTLGILVSLLFVGIVHLVMPPSALQGYVTLAGFVAFIVCYAAGPGVVVWLAISEVQPMAVRAKGMAVALFANSLTSAVLAAVFMYLVALIGYGGVFLLLAFFVLLYLLVAFFFLPETKDRTLEEIEQGWLV